MRKILILLLIPVVAALSIYIYGGADSVAAPNPDGEAGQPEMVVPKPSFEFGKVLEGEVVTHAFTIENRGTAPLNISNVRTSCGCTMAHNPGTIAAGASDSIVVKGNTRGYGGRSFNKTITVTTNDPKEPLVRLYLKGAVTSFALIEPKNVLFSGRADDLQPARVTITPVDGYPFKILKTRLDRALADKVSVDVKETDGVYHVGVRNLVHGKTYYRGKVTFSTDSKIRPELSLYVTGRLAAEKN